MSSVQHRAASAQINGQPTWACRKRDLTPIPSPLPSPPFPLTPFPSLDQRDIDGIITHHTTDVQVTLAELPKVDSPVTELDLSAFIQAQRFSCLTVEFKRRVTLLSQPRSITIAWKSRCTTWDMGNSEMFAVYGTAIAMISALVSRSCGSFSIIPVNAAVFPSANA